MKKYLGIAWAAVLFLLQSGPTSAGQSVEPVCGVRANVLTSLAAKYSESPVAVGVTANGGLIELLSAPDGKTWTILYTQPNQVTCLVASGESWQEITPRTTEPKA
ncbi:MAG: hypothetical protein Unbinned664contig1000_52 [Prokaryotic dsDNA virus sp.]|nr:MAG: hypothetical protein Unbinned664contig1000_52 [Prokaryotic dsDNA virus sp.]|tara:strand:+ start:8953 stop:9267 length:315 start_codon:yes stop_codon:yes gene_type:complete